MLGITGPFMLISGASHWTFDVDVGTDCHVSGSPECYRIAIQGCFREKFLADI